MVWKIQTCNNILMRNRTRLSIDDQIGSHLIKINSQTPFQSQHPLMRKKSSEILSIHKNIQNSTELSRPFSSLYPPTGVHHKKKHSQRYKPQIDTEQNDGPNKLEAGFMSSTENNRITFCKSPAASDQVLGFRAVNIGIQKATSESQSSKKTERQYLKSQRKRNDTLLQKEDSQNSVSQHELEKAVIDLQEHNKNIMIQTKQTVMNFEAYIEQLLDSNQQLQSKLLQYENYIELLENQRTVSLEKQKQREISLEKVVRENITFKRQLSVGASSAAQQKSIAQIGLLKQKIKQYEQQVTSKQELIKLLEESVEEKQGIIKKMTQFNNQMCLQILNLKTSGIETMSDIQNESNRWLSRNKSSQNFKINEQLQNNVTQLENQNIRLKDQNSALMDKIRQMILDDEVMIPYIDDQVNIISNLSEKLNFMTKKIKNYEKYHNSHNSNQNSVDLFVNTSFNGNGKSNKGMIVKNKGNMKYPDINDKIAQVYQSPFEHNFELSEIYPKGSAKLDLNFYPFEQDHSEVYRAILRKIDRLMEILCRKLRKSGQLNLSKSTIENIMRTLTTTLENEENDQQFDQVKENSKSNNILFNLDEQEDSNFASIIRKNEQILTKAAEIKRKLKGHMSRNNENDDGLNGRNASVDRLDFSLNDNISKGLQNSQSSLYFEGLSQKKREESRLAQIFSES